MLLNLGDKNYSARPEILKAYFQKFKSWNNYQVSMTNSTVC